jgi:hypothetical protein
MGQGLIAALFVHPGGVYYGLPNVDPYDEARDARKYRGPHRVIAHPPCKRWGRFATGAWKGNGRFLIGDDEGCFESALLSVHRFGGVIEHPAGSKAWKRFGLPAPGGIGRWSEPDAMGGRSCSVYQSSYGHKCSKPTWLYACDIDFSVTVSAAREPGTHTISVSDWTRSKGKLPLPINERHLTPIPFRDLLISMVSNGQP